MTERNFFSTITRSAVIWLTLAGCLAGSRDTSVKEGLVVVPAVHQRYLSFPVPSAGIEAAFNPPVLRWPPVKGESLKYDVRLSMDSLFESPETISVARTPWAMFNPHLRLNHGRWYWQYRVTGREWSEANSFIVNENSHDLVSPMAERFLDLIPEGHPRILVEGPEINTVRSLKEDADAKAILREAETILRQEIPGENDGLATRSADDEDRNRKLKQDASSALGKRVYTAVNILCQAWLLSGEPMYRQRAIALAREVATWDPQGVTGSEVNDFSDARCMLAMAMAFDTFHSDLSVQERSVLATAISTRANRFYESWINNQEARLLSGHVWQHILHYFFQTSLALHKHEPLAAKWLAYAYELFLARTPILGGKDGGWTEGVSYFRMNMETVIDIPLYIRRFTGFDLFNRHPWYVNNIDWLVYHIPPGSSSDGFGDNSEEVFSPGPEYIAFAKEVAKLTNNPRASWYAQACKQYEQGDQSLNSMLRWIRLVKTRDLRLPDPPADPTLPSGRLFSDIGLVSMHSHPGNTRENLMIALRSSPFGCYGHFLADQNAFNILYGGKRTFFRTGYKVTMSDPHRTGWYQHTKSNNSILIDGEGQPYSTEAFGWIPKFLEGKEIVYALADASNAYSSKELDEDHGVRKFYRHLLLLKPDVVVIYDELESDRDAEWSWLIHSMAEIERDGPENAFQSSFEGVKGVGRLWSANPVQFFLADTFDVPALNWRGTRDASGKLKEYKAEQWHLKAITTEKVSSTRFLAVLRISPDATSQAIAEVSEDGPLAISAGKWTIRAGLNADASPYLMVEDDGGNSKFVYGEDGKAELVDIVDGKEIIVQGAEVMPLSMKQRWLYNKRSVQTNVKP